MAYVAKPNVYSGTDYFTDEDKANLLAKRIRQYWRSRGAVANVWVHSRKSGEGIVFDVRSDMVNGLPPIRMRIRAAT
jgi:hypothetical protein